MSNRIRNLVSMPLLGLFMAGCGGKAAPVETPAAETPVAPAAETADGEAPDPTAGDSSVKQIDEKVTVVNPTDWEIHVELSAGAPDKEETTSSFGPIPPGGQASGNIQVWNTGAFTVKARWEAEGKTVYSQPYTAALSPDEPVTPVTCTLNIPYSSGSMGVWSNVQWEMPPGMDGGE